MRALVVGLGYMGKIHRHALRDLGYDVYAVDPDPETGAEYPSIVDARLAKGSFAVAAITVPIPDLVSAAFQMAGTQMIVEKPFAQTAQQAAMLGAYLERQGPVAVGYVERFNPAVRYHLRPLIARRLITSAKFTRHGARRSHDVEIDLLAHDIDLAHYLDIPLRLCEFDTHDGQEERVRRIHVQFGDNLPPLGLPAEVEVDLMDHEISPVTAMWNAFTHDSPNVARPADAVRVLVELEKRRNAATAIHVPPTREEASTG